MWKQVRCFLCAAAFVGAIQQLQFGAESAVVDDPPESLLPLEQLSALLDHWLPTATGGLTTSPSSIQTPLIMAIFQLERYKHTYGMHQK